jgi:hypothetical protein
MEPIYIRQTELLLRVLPYIHEGGVFALHGGTAILKQTNLDAIVGNFYGNLLITKKKLE